MEDLIEVFLSVSVGYGDGSGNSFGSGSGSDSGAGYGFGYGDCSVSGNGSGAGYGDGFGFDNGYGYGSGHGDGNGFDDGNGYSNGYSISKYKGHKVYKIDYIKTVIESVKGNYARGYIISEDLTTKSCYIARKGDYFAHGATLKEAVRDAQRKYNDNLSEEERIKMFTEQFKRGEKYPAKTFFEWHNTLTGSCEFGRKQFCKEYNINLESDSFTVLEFTELTKSTYGSEIIKAVEKIYVLGDSLTL